MSIQPQKHNHSSLLHKLNSWQPRRVAMLTGTHGTMQVSHLWMAHLAMRHKPVYVVDCAIRFNVFAIADELLKRDQQVEPILENILIRRDFTPYQLLTTMQEIIADPGPYIYFFLSPTKQFFDGDVGQQEGLFLLQKMLRLLQRMQSKNIPVVLVEKPGYRHANFRFIFSQLLKLAHPVWEITSGPESRQNILWSKRHSHIINKY